MNYNIRFMTNDEHRTVNSFSNTIENTIVLNIATKFDESWSAKFGCNNSVRSKESYSGIISSSPYLILDSYKNKEMDIEFLINSDYNIDTVVAIFLSIHLLKTNKLHKYTNELLDLVKSIRNEEFYFNHFNYINVHTVFEAIAHEDRTNEKITNEMKVKYINRGIKFIGAILERLEIVDEVCVSNLFDSSLIQRGIGFDKEIDFVIKDLEIYKSEIMDSEIVRTKKINLFSKVQQKIVKANGMIYLKPSKSKLSTIWSDVKFFHRDNTAYDIRINIVDKFGGKRTDERKKLELDYKVELNRYEIRVRKNSGFKLYNLAKYLEQKEIEKEKEIFNTKEEINIWREYDKKIRRFEDTYWSITRLSWYDGRNHDYNYIDSPTVDSVLTIEDVISEVENHTDNYFDDVDSRIVMPFYYGIKKEDNLNINTLLKKKFIPKNIFNDPNDASDYYINDFFSSNSKKSNIKYYSTGDELTVEIRSFLDTLNLDKNMYEKSKFTVAIFDHGVGMVLFQFHSNNEGKFRISEIDNGIKLISSSCDKIVEMLLEGSNKLEIEVDKPLFYLEGNIVTEITSGGVFTQDAILLSKEESENNDEESRVVMEEKNNSKICKYISKKGISHIEYNLVPKKIDKSYIKKEDYFYIFLFSTYHRVSLIYFSLMLSKFEKLRLGKKIKVLRKNYLSFVTQNWFSQISVNPDLLNHYKRINLCLEIETLNKEVSEQLNAVDDYNQNVFKNKIEALSIIGLPIVFLSTIASIGFFNTNGYVIDMFMIIKTLLFIYFSLILFVMLRQLNK